MALLQPIGYRAHIKRSLGDENDVGTAGYAAVDGDPSGIAAHYFNYDHAVVSLSRRVQAINRLGGDSHGGIEAETKIRPGKVVINGLRYPHNRTAAVEQFLGYGLGVVPADNDQRAQIMLPNGPKTLLNAALLLGGISA